ncbi:MAG: rhomboid family intramembrane serine protease [Alistipes sp.]|nr:rhomboid family intramembrane serine protease [Alistipes sp.]
MNPRFQTPPVVKNLIIVNILIYIATTLLPSANSFLAQYCQLYWFSSPWFHSWQYITYMFLHGGFSHLFFNMFALWMFGRTLEERLGPQRFLTYYIVCGAGAALIQMLVAWLTNDLGISLIGASGAVMGLLLAFGVMYPNSQIFVFPLPFPIKAKWFVMGYAVLELIYGATGYDLGVAHFAHVGGMLWGWMLLIYWKRRRKIWY